MFGLPGSSAGKKSACNAGDPGLIPGLGRSPGEGIGYPPQYSWASLVAQLVKKKSACSVGDLGSIPGLKDPLEKGKATHSSILAWRIPWTVLYSLWGHKESDMTEQLSLSLWNMLTARRELMLSVNFIIASEVDYKF